MTEQLSMWVVYDHPTDFPDNIIARRWVIVGPLFYATEETIKTDDIETMRNDMIMRGLTVLQRSPTDDPKIMEMWI